MLRIRDPFIRLVLLSHLSDRLAELSARERHDVGVAAEAVEHLRGLSTVDLGRLSRMRQVDIRVAIDAAGLSSALSNTHVIAQAARLEAYFIRNGATASMMRTLFKVRRNVIIERRRIYGVRRPAGRVALPPPAICEQICRTWHTLHHLSPRDRYFELHQRFPVHSLAVLAAVVTTWLSAP